MRVLGEFLKERVLKNKKSIPIDDQVVFLLFRKVILEDFGSIGLEKFTPKYYSSQKTLSIETESAIWANELWLKRELIMRKINQEFGERVVSKFQLKPRG